MAILLKDPCRQDASEVAESVRLALYNEALNLVGERPIAGLDENGEPLYLLNSAWDSGALDYCLETGFWTFSLITQRLDANRGVEPDFGHQYVFDVPSDHIRTFGVFLNDRLTTPLYEYVEEQSRIFASHEQIFYRYTSRSMQLGYDASRWPTTFKKYLSAYLATQIAPRLKNETDAREVYALMKDRKDEALSKDATELPSKAYPSGSWSRSRYSRTRYH